jgi:ubiquinone/menaquinone biosynthesis C-methylase UbiE
MSTATTTPPKKKRRLFGTINRILESKGLEKKPPDEYQQFVKRYYNGIAGWFTVISGFLTGHERLAHRVIGAGKFDVRGCKRILDAGTGNGRYLRFLLKQSDSDASLVGCDLSIAMIQRAARRLRDSTLPKKPVHLLTADVTRLPYADETFDAAICGWVMEHLQDQVKGLRELARVLKPGGKLLILTTEDTTLGAMCSRVYDCRTTNRHDFRASCEKAGLIWHKELWWSRVHQIFGLGGIVVELRKPARN